MRIFIFLGLIITLFASCKKVDLSTTNNNPIKTQSYFPLEIGNYWVYQHFQIDTLGNETEIDKMDSLIVTRDTIINDHQYFVIQGIRGNRSNIFQIYRDSLGYLIDNLGIIYFSNSNFTDTLYNFTNTTEIGDTISTTTSRMEKAIQNKTVPAGEFDVLNLRYTITRKQEIAGVNNRRYLDNYYSQSIGPIITSYFFIYQPNIFEKRLIRYFVKEE